ncbi:MAG: signal peptidase I [Rikenellaceae bacterium]
MMELLNKAREFFANKWVRFGSATLLYLLWFCLWTGAWWSIVGVVVIYDIYISGHINRLIGEPLKGVCERSAIARSAYEWVNALIFATVVATLIHTYVFQLYVIPTSSMEKSLLVGDYLYVSKVAYGPKMPNTPIAFPFVHHTMPLSTTAKSFSEAIKWPYNRLRGVKTITREDVVVFNFPAGDTVLLENQSVTYYDVLRGYEAAFGNEIGRKRLFEDYTVITRPVDKRENYIKRLVAMPGDSIRIVDTKLYVNGREENSPEMKQYVYLVRTATPFSNQQLRDLNITEASGNGSIYQMPLTEASRAGIEAMANVISVQRYIATEPNPDIFPHDSRYEWTQDNFGPLWIPKKGETVELTLENLPIYERIISLYEGNDLEVKNGQIYINSEVATSYTFAMNYYWMMGDNRHNSADSRFWGFVPEDHVVGKASFVWMSLDALSSFPSNIRWDRVFKKIE